MLHRPELHTWPMRHTWQTLPGKPHASAPVPVWHFPAESQQPLQLLGLHFAGPHAGVSATKTPNVRPVRKNLEIDMRGKEPPHRRAIQCGEVDSVTRALQTSALATTPLASVASPKSSVGAPVLFRIPIALISVLSIWFTGPLL